jgi:hypothetical protein
MRHAPPPCFVLTTVFASGVATARGEGVAVQMPESFGQA